MGSLCESFISVPAGVVLKDRQTYPIWFATVKYTALNYGTWDLINPDAPDNQVPILAPRKPTEDAVIRQLKEASQARYATRVAEWLALDVVTRAKTTEPTIPGDPTAEEVLRELTAQNDRYEQDQCTYEVITPLLFQFHHWVMTTVSPDVNNLIIMELARRERAGVQNYLRAIKDILAPSKLFCS